MQINWPHKFVKEGQSVGRILTSYSNLEVAFGTMSTLGAANHFDETSKIHKINQRVGLA
jgi:hypothetical protein